MGDDAKRTSALTPSPCTQGEGGEEGAFPIGDQQSAIGNEQNPLPSPLPEYREREQRRHVALFIACLTDQFHPHVGIALTKVLEHFGCRVSFPQSQTCCGQPFYNNGFHDDARTLARRMVEIFEPYEWVVTPSGSCCAMVREHVPRLLQGDHAYEHGAKRIARNTYEFVEFLDRVLKLDLSNLALPAPRKLTYHYTCHLRAIGVRDEAVRMLKQLGNVELIPLEKADQCCGFGGTFAVKYPAISGAIAEDKVNCIARTGAGETVCNDAGCAMNLAGLCHRRGVEQRFVHIAELMAEALGLDPARW